MKDSTNGHRAAFPSLTEGESLQKMQREGLDKLSIFFPVVDFDGRPEEWDRVSMTKPGREGGGSEFSKMVPISDVVSFSEADSDRMADVRVWVGVKVPTDSKRAMYGRVEFNPARFADPLGASVLALDSVESPEDFFMPWIEQTVAKSMQPERSDSAVWRVGRADVARDFEVSNPNYYIDALGQIKRPYSRLNLVHADPSRGRAQTLMCGSRTAGLVRLYDKFAEAPTKVSPDTLRWEVESKSGWLESAGIKVVADLTKKKLADMAYERWEWSGMDVEVSGRREVFERVKRAGLSAAERRGFLGWLWESSEGVPSQLATNTAAKYSKIARGLGVTLTPEVLDREIRFSSRLDWETGKAVCRAA